MEYTKRRRNTINVENHELQDIYQHDLQMYDFPPRGEITLVEFQQLGMERIKLLQHVESNAMRSDLNSQEERKQSLSMLLNKDGLKHFAHLLFAKGCKSSTETDLQYRRKDHISHYIMRLSYSQNEDGQKWYIEQEVEWFKLRFSSLDNEGREKLLKMYKMECTQLSQQEKYEIREQLRTSTSKIINIDTVEFYKVPFRKVTDLIKSRKVYLSQGMAIIPQTDLVSLFVSYFRKNLQDGMPIARECLSNISDDERITSYLKTLPGSFAGMARIIWSSTATPIDKLDELSKTSYPLCMRTLHEALRVNHHLKFSGRTQYGLFLKGIGVTMEDALMFWRTEFTKKIEESKFDKQYAYTIRHIYGKEGRQANYTPLGCTKIITSSIGPGEHHGCPFRHWDQDMLKQKLASYGTPSASINEIADLAKDGHYLIACTSYFKAVHNKLPDKAIIHPNGYFLESRAALAKDEAPDIEMKEKLSQSGINSSPKVMDRHISSPRSTNKSLRSQDRFVTPTKGSDRFVTPTKGSDRFVTPTKGSDRFATPKRGMETSNVTPTRTPKMTSNRIRDDLNNDELLAELMSDDM